MSARATRAIANVRAICDEHLTGRYDLEVIDVYQQPVLATAEQRSGNGTGRSRLIAPRSDLTGYGFPDDYERSAEAGFDHHLVKPVDTCELARLLTQGGVKAETQV